MPTYFTRRFWFDTTSGEAHACIYAACAYQLDTITPLNRQRAWSSWSGAIDAGLITC